MIAQDCATERPKRRGMGAGRAFHPVSQARRLRDNISPTILAVATLLLATVEYLRRRNLRLRGISG